ncbi:MAG TPA: SulP family inorganic anion transporter [Burkholderiaceae bacterium]|nr:SulP family inorganic anion transporter [Burkholderiaceae bacterium]
MGSAPAAARGGFGADLAAGVSIAGLLLPEAVAYSGIANLPPQAGVIGLFAGLACYGLVGSSRFAIVAATSSSAAVLAAAVASITTDPALRLALASGLILLTGAFFVAAGLARIGGAASLISRPVLRGFAFGLAIVITLKQLPKMVAFHPQASQIVPFAWELASHFREWNPYGLAVGAAALVLLRLLAPLAMIPGALIVIALGIGAGMAWPLHDHGVEVVGRIDLALGWPSIPRLAIHDWLRLGEVAFALMLVLFAESYGSIRTFALKHGDRVQPDRDLLGLGIANLGAGLFNGMPVGAGYSATSANEAAGAQSRAAGWYAASVVLLIVLFALDWIARTPEPVLAAIVIHAVGHSLNPALFKPYFAWRRDRVIVASAVAAVIVLGVLDGLLAAIAVSLLMMLRNLAEPKLSVLGRLGDGHDFVDVALHPEARQVAGILTVRPEAPLFFANAERMLAIALHLLPRDGSVHALILSLEESPDIDATTVEALRDFAGSLKERGVRLWLARVKEPVRDLLNRAGIAELPAECFTGWSVDDAVGAAAAALGT